MWNIYLWFFKLYPIALWAAALLVLLALWLTRGQRALRSKLVSLSMAAPFACLAGTLVALIVGFAVAGIPSAQPRRGDAEPGILPNGYVLMMSQDWRNGYISKGMSQHPDPRFAHRYGVTELQVSGDLLLGRSDLTEKLGMNYFILDTRSGTLKEYPDSNALWDAAQTRGVRLLMHPPCEAFITAGRREGLNAHWLLSLLWPIDLGILGVWIWRMWTTTRPPKIKVTLTLLG